MIEPLRFSIDVSSFLFASSDALMIIAATEANVALSLSLELYSLLD